MSEALRLGDRLVWTPEYLDELAADGKHGEVDWRRYEILDGALVVSPPPAPRHEFVVAELIGAIRGAEMPGFRVIAAVGVRLGLTYLVTDVTVVSEKALRSGDGILSPADVLLAIEIESPHSVTTDRLVKPAKYAAAGIPHYWRVQTDELALHTYRLVGDVYTEAGSWHAEETAEIRDPFELDLVMAALVP